jgi:hypothetical protein
MDLRAHVQGWILLLTGGIVAGLLEQVNRAATSVGFVILPSPPEAGAWDIAVDVRAAGGYR